MQPDGSDRRVLTASLDRQCARTRSSASRSGTATASPSASRTAATSTSTRSRRTARASRSSSSAASSHRPLRPRRRRARVHREHAHAPARALLRRREAHHVSLPTSSRAAARSSTSSGSPRSPPTGPRSTRGSCAHPALRRGRVPDAAHDPRRPVRAVRHGLLRRGPGLFGRRLLRALLQPARRLGLLRGVGPRDLRARSAASAGLGRGRLRGRDGRRRHRAREVSVPRRGEARRARRVVRRLHDEVDRGSHEALQGGALGEVRQPAS